MISSKSFNGIKDRLKGKKEMIIESIKSAFKEHFNRVPIIVRSPGSINLIGDHTSFNDGCVLPVAINIFTYVAVSRRNDEEIHLFSESFGEAFKIKLFDLKKTEKDWVNYILGVADQLQKWDYQIGGFNVYIDGDVPLDSEFSSPAAIACATTYALIELFSLSVPKLDIAKIAQMAEQNFIGINNGIINQFVSVFGKKNNAILLDEKSLCHDYIPLKMDGYQLVLLNTNVKDLVPNIACNKGKEQCEEGLEWIKTNVSQVTSLRDVNIKMLNKYVKRKDIDVYQKCKFIVEENQRVLMAAEYLKNGNLKGLNQLMFQAHEASKLFCEIGYKELDFLVDEVKNLPYVLGTRMMGGRFKGYTLSIVKEEKIDDLIEELTSIFEDKFHLELDGYVVEIEDGTTLIL